jgi:thymidylate kinase
MLQAWLKKRGRPSIVTKAYDDMAKLACRPFIDTWTDDTAIMFLFQALHAQQYADTLQALQKGLIVIADRWDETFLAYHQNFGFLSQQEETRVLLNRLAFHEHLPENGFLIKVPVNVAKRRREARGKVEKLEDRPGEYYEAIQQTLIGISLERNWNILDGTKTPIEIHEEIVNSIGSQT